MNKLRISGAICLLVSAAAVISACSGKRSPGWEYARNMYDPIGYNPDQPNKNFTNGQTAQRPPGGTVPIGFSKEKEYENTVEGYNAASAEMKNPFPVTIPNLMEGKQLYLAMCKHCHGFQGKGDGSLVQLEKFPAPPSYSDGTSSRGGSMADLTDGKIFHTITYGWGQMGPHRSQLTPDERWKIVMYVHELQKLK